MKIILIGNYPPDKQESMKLFSKMLSSGFSDSGVRSETWLPTIFFGRFSKNTNKGLGKWLGYLDKWILFPVILKSRLLKKKYKDPGINFHICDHSNSPYLAYLPRSKSAITCHDVLAIRGALGFEDAHCEASRFGIVLQKWILKNLLSAKKLAAVSALTYQQLEELRNGLQNGQSNWQVIHNAFNQDFHPLSMPVCEEKLPEIGFIKTQPFLLHLGSSLERKNRKLLVDMLIELEDDWEGIVCFAGDPIDTDLQFHINKLGLQNRVKSIVKPSHEKLLVLYSCCDAFIFPSFSEGFGWPIIEAQACGAPVIASNIEPMPEVSGGAALHESPGDAEAFARAFLTLKKTETREKLIAAGFENIKRFSVGQMIKAYLSLHSHLKN